MWWLSTLTSPIDINVPTRSALVLETKACFLLLRFVNSDVSYYGHRISEKKKGTENTASSHAKLTRVSWNQSLIDQPGIRGLSCARRLAASSNLNFCFVSFWFFFLYISSFSYLLFINDFFVTYIYIFKKNILFPMKTAKGHFQLLPLWRVFLKNCTDTCFLFLFISPFTLQSSAYI